MQPVAQIRLLGEFQDAFAGVDVPSLGSTRLQSLLAYLLLHRDAPQPRQRLASALWPDSSEAQARTNLRHLLHTLRQCVPDAPRYLEITSRTVRWRPDAAVWFDVGAFEDLLTSGTCGASISSATEGSGEARRNALREAVELYGGDLMDGCGDEWLVAERDRLRRRHLDALAELAQLCEARGELDEAIRYAEQLMRLDELREDVHRQLMRLHAGRGDRAAAIRVFHLCSTTLERELGVAPSAPTRAAYQALLAGEASAPMAQPERTAGPPLVGRSAEWARLTAALRSAQARTAQLVVVTGEAGAGKSRLVEEFRRSFVRRGGVASEARCYPAEGPLAYGPVVDWLRSAAVRPRLPKLDDVRLSELARLLPELLVGGGATQADLDTATQAHGLAVTGGTISHTGVGGLTLGGGMGWLTRMCGLAVDNLVSAQVVLADGRCVRAAPDEHPDLFWALTGGGGNFGVVTEFEFRLHPVGPLVHLGLLFWELGRSAAAFRAARDTVDALPRDTGGQIIAMNVPPAPFVPAEHHFVPGVALVVVGFSSTEEHGALLAGPRRRLAPLFELVTELPYTGLQQMLDEAAPWGVHAYNKSLHLDELSDQVIDVVVERLPGKASPMSLIPIFTLGGAYADRGDDDTAFGGRRSSRYVLNIEAVAPDPETLAVDREWVRSMWPLYVPSRPGPATTSTS